MADADIVYRMLQRDPALHTAASEYIPAGLNEEIIYVYILPVLQAGDPSRFETARTAFQAIPAQGWESYANRAAVLQEIGDLPGALNMSARALAEAPNDPGVLNNHCYILLQAGRAADALPFCERAVAAAPNAAEDTTTQVRTVESAYNLLLDHYVHPLNTTELLNAGWDELTKEAANKAAKPAPAPQLSRKMPTSSKPK